MSCHRLMKSSAPEVNTYEGAFGFAELLTPPRGVVSELKDARDHQSHIVVLGSAGGEGVGGGQDVVDHLHRRHIETGTGGGDQGVLAPFVFGGILRLADAVGVE